MAYTVKKLSELSGVSVRTLHHYDEIDLLKPAYFGANGYRYYEEEQLLLLQQILFYRKLKMPLKDIQKVLIQSDFNQKAALLSHRKILLKEMTRLQELVCTIDKTLKHHKGEIQMEHEEIFDGFLDKEKLSRFEAYMIKRLGEPYKQVVLESKKRSEQLSQDDWLEYFKETNEINKALVKLSPTSREVQEIVRKHYESTLRFYTPTKEIYVGSAEVMLEQQFAREAYEKWHPDLGAFLAKGMKIFAENEL
ncbi:MerR family transcriptional regulator [Simkania sp.]|uniref:MerR family transcriptional regulator n=1 Tax=Simkania sp. TaxID=34094 RepID=UPI003B52C24A